MRGGILDISSSTINQSREKKHVTSTQAKESEGLTVFKDSLARMKAEAKASQLSSAKYKRALVST